MSAVVTLHRTCWLLAAWSVGIGASAAAVVVVGPVAAVTVVVAFAALGAMCAVALAEDDRQARARAAVAWSGRSALGGAVLVGLGDAGGPWALLVLLGLGVTSPEVAALVRSAPGRPRPAASTSPDQLSDAALLRRWRATSATLRGRDASTAQRLDLVRERERLLDELERRHGDELAAWLERAVGLL